MIVYLAGFKELSLIDYPAEPSCVFWFAGCNFRCPYCYNFSFWKMEERYATEISKLKELMENASILSRACKVTGGEPTLQPKALIELGLKAHKIDMKFGVDTNGSNPKVIRDLIFKYNCLDHLAIDIKAPFIPEHYRKAVGLNISSQTINKIKETIRIAFNSKVKLELRIPLIPLINDSHQSLEKISREIIKLGYLDNYSEKRLSLVLVEVITEKSVDHRLKELRKLNPHEMVELALRMNLPGIFIRHRKLGGKIPVDEAVKILKS